MRCQQSCQHFCASSIKKFVEQDLQKIENRLIHIIYSLSVISNQTFQPRGHASGIQTIETHNINLQRGLPGLLNNDARSQQSTGHWRVFAIVFQFCLVQFLNSWLFAVLHDQSNYVIYKANSCKRCRSRNMKRESRCWCCALYMTT